MTGCEHRNGPYMARKTQQFSDLVFLEGTDPAGLDAAFMTGKHYVRGGDRRVLDCVQDPAVAILAHRAYIIGADHEDDRSGGNVLLAKRGQRQRLPDTFVGNDHDVPRLTVSGARCEAGAFKDI